MIYIFCLRGEFKPCKQCWSMTKQNVWGGALRGSGNEIGRDIEKEREREKVSKARRGHARAGARRQDDNVSNVGNEIGQKRKLYTRQKLLRRRRRGRGRRRRRSREI